MLEAQQRGPDDRAATAEGAERFHAKFLDLVERQQGQPPGPNDSPIVHIAAQFWTDPEGALARLKAAAWRTGGTDGHT